MGRTCGVLSNRVCASSPNYAITVIALRGAVPVVETNVFLIAAVTNCIDILRT